MATIWSSSPLIGGGGSGRSRGGGRREKGGETAPARRPRAPRAAGGPGRARAHAPAIRQETALPSNRAVLTTMARATGSRIESQPLSGDTYAIDSRRGGAMFSRECYLFKVSSG